jgi:asparagine synthase (glutamine-hydrolysing)
VRRSKQPYRAPDAASFFRDGKPLPYVRELLGERQLRAAGYFDPAATALLVDKCARGAAIGFVDNMAFVAVLSTMLVHEMFVARLAPFEAGQVSC